MSRKPTGDTAMTPARRRARLKETVHTVPKKRGRPRCVADWCYGEHGKYKTIRTHTDQYLSAIATLHVLDMHDPTPANPQFRGAGKERFKWLYDPKAHTVRDGILTEIGRIATQIDHETAREFADIMCAEKPTTKEAIEQLRGARLWLLKADAE